MSADLATVPKNEATVVNADFSVKFTAEQRKLILDTCCNGASEKEAAALIAIAEARGMNPILGECYFVKRYDSASRQEKWAVQASIDSFRIRAEQTGLYAGQDEPEFEFDDRGIPTVARVRIYRKDWARPVVGVAYFDEYVQKTKDGSPTRFWKTMPKNQLAKCAEAQGLRKGFPKALAKVYVPEEMEQADNVIDVSATATQIQGREKPLLSAPSIDEEESKKLTEQIIVLMEASASPKDLDAALAEATKAKPKLLKGHQKMLAGVFRNIEQHFIEKAEAEQDEKAAVE